MSADDVVPDAFESTDMITASAQTERERLCSCSPTAQIVAYAIIGLLSLFMFWAFFNNFKFVQESAEEKVELRELVVAEAADLDALLYEGGLAETKEMGGLPYFGDLERAEVGKFGRDSFWFVLDFDSRFWTMGGNPLLAMQQTADGAVVRPGAFSAQDMDESTTDNPIADFIRVAKRGGGYVEFRWKDNVPMMAYVTTTEHYPFIVGAAMPLDG